MVGCFNVDFEKIQPHSAKKKVLPQDNARVHKCATGKFKELGYELLPCQPYSSDLPPSDYFLLLNRKNLLCRKRFSSNEDIVVQIITPFRYLDKNVCLRSVNPSSNINTFTKYSRNFYPLIAT